jgi:type IV secretory pathway VirB4 component
MASNACLREPSNQGSVVFKGLYSHWATSEDLSNLNLSLHDAGSGLTGKGLGACLRGGEFVFDPFSAYTEGLVTNPNMVLVGAIGVGKSTLVKMQLLRGIAEGRSAVIVDPKGEYEALAKEFGVRPITFGRDGWCNPFVGQIHECQSLLRAMLAAAQGEELNASQHFQVSRLWNQLIQPGEPHVLRTLFEGVKDHLADTGDSAERNLALLLYRFVLGDLAGLFEGPGEPLSLHGQVTVLDLSQHWAGENVALIAMSAIAVAQHALVAQKAPGYLVIDEAWAILRDASTLKWLQGSWKLARSRGISHILVLHRWSDIASTGDRGSAHRERAAGLLRECETCWLFRQGNEEAKEMASIIGLNQIELGLLTTLPKGAALVRYAQYRSVVAFRPDSLDQTVTNTDQAML